MIKLKFEEKEYLRLMELVYLGNWMINSIKEETNDKYEELESKVFSNAVTAGFSNTAEYDEELKRYFPTVEFEDSVWKYIDEYNEYNFWESLIRHMAYRDIREKYKDRREDFDKLSREEKWEEIRELQEKYRIEFAKYGLDRLFIKK